MSKNAHIDKDGYFDILTTTSHAVWHKNNEDGTFSLLALRDLKRIIQLIVIKIYVKRNASVFVEMKVIGKGKFCRKWKGDKGAFIRKKEKKNFGCRYLK